GEAGHSLDALTGLAAYSRLKEGETSFEVNMLAEVDGVTNGPMLSHLLMGAASSIEQLFSMLNRGGFYQVGSSFDQFNDWRSTSGNMDLYETTTMNTLDRLNWMIGQREIDGRIKNAVEVFMGKLRDDTTGAILK